MFNTLTHRDRTVCANTWLLYKEEEYIRGALLGASTTNGPVIDLRPKATTNVVTHRGTPTTTIATIMWWYPTQRDSVKVSRTFVVK